MQKTRTMKNNDYNTQLIDLQGRLEKFALSLTANREEALDLLQETYLKALQNKRLFQESTNLKAWVFTIMKNTFINNYRKSVRRKVSNDQTDNKYFINSSTFHVIETPDSKMFHEEMHKYVDGLDDHFKIPFKMHTEGYKYHEIADELDLKIGTVKSRIFLSRQKLMDQLDGYGYK